MNTNMMDCFSQEPIEIIFCDVNQPCEICPRFADDCDGDEKYMANWEEFADDTEDDHGVYYVRANKMSRNVTNI